MAWAKRPTAAKYRTREHRRARAQALAELARLGSVECAQPVCLMPSRTIYDGEPAHLGHNEAGTAYIGLVHPACNVHEAAVRASARSRGDGIAHGWAL